MSRLRTAAEYNFESELVQDLLLEFGAVPYVRVWRNNVGVAYGMGAVMDLVTRITKLCRFATANARAINEAIKIFRNTVRPIKFSVPGSPDITGFLTGDAITGQNRGRSFWIECKIKNNTLDPDQATWREMAEQRGVVFILAYCVMDVYRGLEAAGVLTSEQVTAEIARRR